ncbi:unnamed protein product, partial [Natator depressus]
WERQGRTFLGATNSAVPCAILLELATALDAKLLKAKEIGDWSCFEQGVGLDELLRSLPTLIFYDSMILRSSGSEVTLQLLFLDRRRPSGSGVRGIPCTGLSMAKAQHQPGTSQLQAMSLFILLDLLGAHHPTIQNHFPFTASWFDRLVGINTKPSFLPG